MTWPNAARSALRWQPGSRSACTELRARIAPGAQSRALFLTTPMNKLDDPLHDAEVGSRDSTIDTTRIDDVRISAVRPLITPALLQERVPVRDDTLALV